MFKMHFICLLIAGKHLVTIRAANAEDVNSAVSNSKAAFSAWGLQTSGFQRGKILQKASELIRVSAIEKKRLIVHN